ncbi:MAG: prepilin-type N-terminal cleavage/methylation domain-containing protein [Oscillospiraceae bacterium]|nr:prepilin-type N-terminal cleavage/methylation domain-containing protein [Oscillospiraceae bacterium]
MKKFLKGFTLVELIIVMAILTILMAAIMQMFKPIRSTYVDATLYENQRTVQNGIVTYLAESIRYSTDLGIYPKDKITSSSGQNVVGAVDDFTKAYLKANGVYPAGNPEGKPADPQYAAKYSATLEKIQRTAEVIIIDNDTNKYIYNNVSGWQGRILRRKFESDTSYNASTDPEYKKYKKITTDAEDYTKTDSCRMALGAPYYGERHYSILLEEGIGNITDATAVGKNKAEVSDGKWKADEGIKITVSSQNPRSSRLTENSGWISVSGEVMCKNQCNPINGMFDVSTLSAPAVGKPIATPTSGNTKIYIVYINNKVEITTS